MRCPHCGEAMQPGRFAVDAPALAYLNTITTSMARLYFAPVDAEGRSAREEVMTFGAPMLPGYRCGGCHMLVIVGNPSVLNPHWDEDAWRGGKA